ncbi:SHOCT domain-containing protein [Alteromonas stellipolaris]|uniref:SHOCT domain-containing protein n=1 Tax=Alteromonas stellipolaris TaxID=233316 RepID=UPI0024942F08|nr:SHOCT domain-containing protein [Alteromonas stellipolaris]
MMKLTLKIQLAIISIFFATPSFSSNTILWSEDENTVIKIQDNNFEGKKSRKFDITESELIAQKNSQPVVLNERDVLKFLSSIKIVKNKNTTEPLFTEEQQSNLAKYLAIGLKKASPHQDILFSLAREKRALGGLKKQTYFIAGRAFFNDGLLNLIIGEYNRLANSAYEMAYDPTNQGLVEYDFNYGDRAASKFQFSEKLQFTFSGMSMKPDRTDWVTVNLEELQKTISSTENLKEALKPNEDTLIKRFKTLEKLKKEGLITQEEYEQKRKVLLENL